MTDGVVSKSKIHPSDSAKLPGDNSGILRSLSSAETLGGPSKIHLYAIKGDIFKLQEELQINKRDINEVDQLRMTPLVYSVLGEQIECVSMLLKMGADINITDVDERTALHWAAYQGNHKLVKLLLSKGADKVKRDIEGKTPLHLSISHDNIKVMEALLSSMKEQEINLHDNNKVTPLFLSVFYDRINHTKLLLKYGADPFKVDKESRTVLHWTSQNEDDSILRLLVKYVEKYINCVDCQGHTVLHMAIGKSNKILVDCLLSIKSIDINCKDKMGRTPLHWAALLGDTAIVSLLLDKGADFKICDENGVYPLHCAAQTDSVETVIALLGQEGIQDLPDNEHEGTALMWAAAKGSYKVLKLLLEKKCSDINAMDSNNQTALHKCSQAGHLKCVRTLIEHGADVNIYDKKSHIPLFYACSSGHEDIVNELLVNGSSQNLDGKDADGRCPIHYAVLVDRRTDIIKILLEHKSNANTQDNDGCTPLHFASFYGFVHCISVLIENGAKVNLQDNLGRTALHRACQSGNVDAVKLLVSRYNASVNIFAHEDEDLTPLDYALIGDHQNVASYLLGEHNAARACHLKEISAQKIQATWRGYRFRKNWKPHKHLYLKHDMERKNVLLNSKNEFNNNSPLLDTPSLLFSDTNLLNKDIDSQSIYSRNDIKLRSNVSVVSSKTFSSSSSVFFPTEKVTYEDISKSTFSPNGKSTLQSLSISSSKDINKGLKKNIINAPQDIPMVRKAHKNSTSSMHSYPYYHHSHISSSSSDFYINNINSKRNEERNNLLNKSYSRHVSASVHDVNVQSSSSESSILFDSRPNKPVYNSLSNLNVFEPKFMQPKDFKKKEQQPLIKAKIVQPDTTLEKPWNIYRINQKRILKIRQQTVAALKIQKAYKDYIYKKYSYKEYRSKKEFCVKVTDLTDPKLDSNTFERIEESNDLDELKNSIDSEANQIFLESSNSTKSYEEFQALSSDTFSGNITLNIEEHDDAYIGDVAALIIQLAWREYVKRKLLVENKQTNKIKNSINTSSVSKSDKKDEDLKKLIEPNKKKEIILSNTPIQRKSSGNIKKDVSNPPLSFLEKAYFPLQRNYAIQRVALDEPPISCKSPSHSSSKQNNTGKYMVPFKQTAVKKPVPKGMKVK